MRLHKPPTAAADGILLVDRDGVDARPVHRFVGVGLVAGAARAQAVGQSPGAAAYVEAAGEQTFALHAALDTVVHHRPALEQSRANFLRAAQRILVHPHHFRNALSGELTVLQELRRVSERIGNMSSLGGIGGALRFRLVDHESSAD